MLPKVTPGFCQPGDEVRITEKGFRNAIPIETSYTWVGITITRTDGKHGSGKILDLIGDVSGFVFQANGKPTVYWVGDSIWCEEVESAINMFNPDIILIHSGGAKIPGYESIIMDADLRISV